MDVIACLPADLPHEVSSTLNFLGTSWKPFDNLDSLLSSLETQNFSLVLVCITKETSYCREYLYELQNNSVDCPVLAVFDKQELKSTSVDEPVFDDFCLIDAVDTELGFRIGRALKKNWSDAAPEVVEYDAIKIDPSTYQASVEGRPLDLTFMEYQLLAFLVTHAGKVYSRETLLSRVWGYEYYGGARTVDVHIRRLRAKLGEEYGNYIQTIRSVGYKFARIRQKQILIH